MEGSRFAHVAALMVHLCKRKVKLAANYDLYQLKLYICRRRLVFMNLHCRSVIRALAFLLLVGPLQAQQVFVCGMMDTIFLGDCCCEDHNYCADAGCSDAVTTENNQCCEESIELSFNIGANDEVNVIKSVEIRSNIDPPPIIVFAGEPLVEPIRFTETSYLYTAFPDSPGSNIYLITQRLRI